MNKRHIINSIFALIVIALGTGAVLSLVLNPENPIAGERAPTGPSNETLPENHPPVDLDQRLSTLIQMSTDDPENADIHAEIGNMLYDMEDFEKAIVAYQKSLDLQPGNPYIETDMATSLHRLGRHDEALEILEGVIAYQADFAQALYNKGVILIHGKDDIENGIAAWEEFLKLDIESTRKAELRESIRQMKQSIR